MAWTLHLMVYLVMTGMLECDEIKHRGKLKEFEENKHVVLGWGEVTKVCENQPSRRGQVSVV